VGLRPHWALSVLTIVVVGACARAPQQQVVPSTALALSGEGPASTQATQPASELVQQILSDGDVSRAEFDRAWSSYAACTREQGVELVEESYLPYQFSFTANAVTKGALSNEAIDSISNACSVRFFGPVKDAYLIAHSPSPAETETLRKQVASCLVEAGAKVRLSDSLDDLQSTAGVSFPKCYESTLRALTK
jgi:hypothetical protein